MPCVPAAVVVHISPSVALSLEFRSLMHLVQSWVPFPKSRVNLDPITLCNLC